MNPDSPNPPYFEVLFDRIAAGDDDAVKAFGRHVHWSFWDNSEQATYDATDYCEAAERLCLRIFDAAGIASGQRLVDVGCGFGGTIGSLNERYDQLTSAT